MKKILIVEDDPILLKIYTAKFSKNGYEVVAASGGEEGIRKVGEEKPDLVIVDLMMPKVDGVEVLRKLKSNEETKNIPVAILTVIHHETVDLPKDLLDQVVYYWIKDQVNPSDVLNDVKKILGDN